ncbi:MAG: T9SS type A sorting domain-containing protein [Agriterribacter sp.]
MNQKNHGGYKKSSNILYALSLIVTTILFTFSSAFLYGQTMQTTQKAVYTRITSNVGGYMESLPNDYNNNPSKKYPLLIALAGVGERGNGSPGVLEKVTNVGIPKLLKNNGFPASFTVGGQSYSFIVISPEMESTSNWAIDVNEIINYCKTKYRVDASRIYLTGLSLGGVATWSYSVTWGDQIAAAVLVCPGVTANATTAKAISTFQLPLWVTNNLNDGTINYLTAVNLVNTLTNTVPAPPKPLITIFNASGHDAWTQTYNPSFKQDGLNVYEWMLSKSRGTAQPAPAKPVLTANAGANQVITLPTNSVKLDGTGSNVTSGKITSYAWLKISGPGSHNVIAPSSPITEIKNLVAGTYVFQLTIKDSNGSTATSTVTVTVNAAAANSTVTASAGNTQYLTLPTNTTTLDGSASTATAGIASYSWTKIGGPSSGTIVSPTSAKTVIKDLVAGGYTFRLIVTDKNGKSDNKDVIVTVYPAPGTITVNAGNAQYITLPTNTTTLDGSASTAVAGIASYSWTKIGGPSNCTIVSPTSAKTVIKDLVAGDYTFRLVVTDKNGVSLNKDVMVTVGTAKLTVSAGNTQYLTLPTNTTTLDGSASSATAGIASYSWTKIGGPSSGTIVSPASAKTVIKDLVAGGYTFRLVVTDKNGTSLNKDVIITVYPAPGTITVNAGNTQYLTLPTNTTTLDGSASTATAGIASYSWTKIGGPSAGTIVSPASAKTVIKDLVAGGYTFRLVVTDKNGVSLNKDVVVTVNAAASQRTANGEVAAASSSIVSRPEAEELASEFNFKVSPNPVQSDMNLVISGAAKGKTSIIVYSLDGKSLLQQEFMKDGSGTVNKSVNVSKLPAGVYIVQIIVDGKYRKVLRIVKR